MNITANLEIKAEGEYQLEIPGKVKTGWFKNLLLDQGLNNMTTTNDAFRFCQVGTGSTVPAFGQTALAARVAGVQASSGGNPSPTGTATIDTDNRQWICTWTYTFNAGTFSGQNLSEVGTGTSDTGTTLSSRALIVDNLGNPTTITPLAEDDLVVRYRLRINQPTVDFVVGGATIRAANVNTIGASTDGAAWHIGFQQFLVTRMRGWLSGTLGAITSGPTGSGQVNSDGGQTQGAYTPGSFTRQGSSRFGATQLNGTTADTFAWGFGPTAWQMKLDTPITKANPQTLRVTVSLTWARA